MDRTTSGSRWWSRYLPRGSRRRWAIGSALAIAVGGLVAIWLAVAHNEHRSITLAMALEQLERGQLQEAKRLAILLHAKDILPYQQRGGPPYILGRVILADPQPPGTTRTRRQMYAVATRYLQEAYERGFPHGHRAVGLQSYALSLMLTGQYDRCLEIYAEALQAAPARPSLVHRRLAQAHLLADGFDLQAALAHVDAFLADRSIAASERHEALLDKSRILLRGGDLSSAAEVLSLIPSGSGLQQDIDIQRASLLIATAQQGENERAEGTDDEQQVRQAAVQYQLALDTVRPYIEAAARGRSRSAAHLLAGLCYQNLRMPDAAIDQFVRARRLESDSPAAWAATLFLAELQSNANGTQSMALYRQLARESMGGLDRYNPWLFGIDVRRCLNDRYLRLLQLDRYEDALKFCDAVSGLLPAADVLELKASAYRSWGQKLAELPGGASRGAADLAADPSRLKYRLAGSCYQRLAAQRFSSPLYTQDLWRAGASYLRGHAFAAAATCLAQYMDHEPRRRRPLALINMARCQLALGDPNAAAAYASQCVASHSQHPLVYQARILLAQAELERGHIDQAQSLLRQNLYRETLTLNPRSVQWRDSLFLLGEMLYRQGTRQIMSAGGDGGTQYTAVSDRQEPTSSDQSQQTLREAAGKLNEALQRYPDAPQATLARYQLAETHRRLAKQLRVLLHAHPDSTMYDQWHSSLQQEAAAARDGFARLRQDLLAIQDAREVSPVEQALLRNCWFALADAQFELGEYNAAIAIYQSAARRYADEPIGLESYVRLAECYRQLEQFDAACDQLQLAQRLLDRLPTDLPFRSTTRYDRQQWAHALHWMIELFASDAGTNKDRPENDFRSPLAPLGETAG